MLKPGEIVDRYEVLARLGEGGMATVYLVRHTKLDSRHALKVHSSNKATIKMRFSREGRLQASLRHENVVAVSDVIDLGDRAGLVMEYVEGPTLSGLLRRFRPPLCDAVVLLVNLAVVSTDMRKANSDVGDLYLPTTDSERMNNAAR